MRRRIIICFLLSLILVLTSCGSTLEGKYNLASARYNKDNRMYMETGSGEWIEFTEEENSAEVYLNGETHKCEYSIKSGEISITGEGVSLDGTVSKDYITLYNIVDGVTVVYIYAVADSDVEHAFVDQVARFNAAYDDSERVFELVSDIVMTSDEEIELGYEGRGSSLTLELGGAATLVENDSEPVTTEYRYTEDGDSITLSNDTTTIDGKITSDGNEGKIVLMSEGSNEEWGAYNRQTTYATKDYYEFSALKKETRERLYLQGLVEQPEPSNGTVLYSAGSGYIWPLTIRPAEGDSDSYYFKVKDKGSGDLIMTFYLSHANDVTIKLPVGSYSISYASGETWYGEENLFGPDTTYVKFSDYIDIEANYEMIIEMEEQVGGNLASVSLNPENF